MILSPQSEQKSPVSSPEPTPLRDLMPHQEKALAYCRTRQHPALIMQMRLGKTLTLIRWAQEAVEFPGYKLVVAPLTVLNSWRAELTKEGEEFTDLHRLYKDERERALLYRKTNHWYLANYEMIRSMPEIAKQMRWSLVTLDESTRIANPTAKITKLCIEGFRTASHRAILTGLPSPESELQLFSQFKFLHGIFMHCSSFWKFKANYFELEDPINPYKYVPKPGVKEVIKDMMHEKAFVMTKKQAGIGNKKLYQVRTVEMEPALRKIYRKVERDFSFIGADGETLNETQWAMVAEGWLGRLAGGFSPEEPNPLLSPAKANAILELLTGELSDEQVVIWCRFNAEIEYLTKRLRDAGISNRHISGDVVNDERGRTLDAFREGKIKVIVAQGSCARYGVDCSAASTAFYYSNHYSCEIREQSEERIEHPMKHEPLLIVDFVTEDTVDEDAVTVLQDKTVRAHGMMIYHKIREGIERRRGK